MIYFLCFATHTPFALTLDTLDDAAKGTAEGTASSDGIADEPSNASAGGGSLSTTIEVTSFHSGDFFGILNLLCAPGVDGGGGFHSPVTVVAASKKVKLVSFSVEDIAKLPHAMAHSIFEKVFKAMVDRHFM